MRKTKYRQAVLLLNLFFLIGCFSPFAITAQTTENKKLTPRQIADNVLPSVVLIITQDENHHHSAVWKFRINKQF